MADETLAFTILARDNASSTFRKVARSSDDVNSAMKKTMKISDDAARSSAVLRKARDRESDSLGKVRVAEANLADVRGRANAKAVQIARAEEVLNKARRDSARASSDVIREETRVNQNRDRDFHTSGEKSGKSFLSGIASIFRTGAKDAEKAGTVLGESTASGIQGSLKTPYIGPAILVAAAAAAATAAPAAGAVLASGLVAGFGAGIAGLGIVFAAKSDAVQAKWKSTLTEMGAETTVLSRPFESTLSDMAAVAKRTFDRFAPELGSAFAKIAPQLTQFGDQAGRAFERLAPVVQPLASAFTEVLKSLGPALQSAVGNIAQGLDRLSSSVQKNPDGLADLVKGAGGLTTAAIDLVTELNDVNGAIERLTGGASGVDIVMGALTATVDTARFAVGTLTAPLRAADGLMGKLGLHTKDTGTDTGTFSDNLSGAITRIRDLIPASAGGGKAVETLAQKFDRQWAATQRANDALFRNSGLLLTLSGAEISYQAAVDAATESVKQNGHTHDINTEKGRANKTALDQIAASANTVTENARNSGKASVTAAESARKAYEKQAVQMGYTKGQAHAMAAEFVKIPKKTVADFKGDITDLDSKIKKAKTQLADPKLTPTKRAHLEATISQLLAQKKKAQAAIDGLHGKTVAITSTYTEIHRVINQGSRSSSGGVGGGHEITGKGSAGGGLIPGRPSSIDNILKPMATGEYVVQASKVPGNLGLLEAINSGKFQSGGAPAAPRASRQAPATGRAAEQRIVLEIRAGDSGPYSDFLVRELRKYIRGNGGGNVQATLGA